MMLKGQSGKASTIPVTAVLILILLPSAFAAAAAPAPPPTRQDERMWLYELVERVPWLSGERIMLLDGSDLPHVVYRAGTGLYYSSFDGDSWTSKFVEGTNDNTIETAAEVDGEGYPRIVYYDQELSLNYTWKDLKGWHSSTIDTGYCVMGSIDVDGNGTSHVAYKRYGSLCYLSVPEANGTPEHRSVLSIGTFYGISLRVSSSGMVHISCSNRSGTEGDRLEHYYKDAAGWHKETIPEGSGAFSFTALRLDPLEQPRICYAVRSYKDRLDMVSWNGASWKHEVLDPEISSLLFDFELDPDGDPHLITDYSVYEHWTGSEMVESVIDFEPFYCTGDCMRFDSMGYLHIAGSVEYETSYAMGHITYGYENERPLADAGYDREAELGEACPLNGEFCIDNDELERFIWTVSSGDRSEVLEGSLTYFMPDRLGPYDVTVRAVDRSGNWDEDEAVITVLDRTYPVAIAGANVSVFQHALVGFNASASTDNSHELNFTWTIGAAPEVVLYGLTPSYTFHDAGIFNVTLTVTDGSGNQGTDTLSVKVTDTTPPMMATFDDIEMDQYQTAHLSGSACSDNVGITYYNWTIWSGGDIRYLEGESVSLELLEAGEYEFNLWVSDASGNSNTTTFYGLARDREPPVASFECPDAVPAGQELYLNGYDSTDNMNIVNWTWTFACGDYVYQYEGAEVSVYITVPGNYTVNLTVTDSSGLTSSSFSWVVVTGPGGDDGGNGRTWLWALLASTALVLIIAVAVVAWIVIRKRRKGPGISDAPLVEGAPDYAHDEILEEFMKREREKGSAPGPEGPPAAPAVPPSGQMDKPPIGP